MSESTIGQALPRREDPRFLTGRAQFAADITLPRQTHAVFVRSPCAHARLLAVDAQAAREAPGVHLVLTGADFRACGGLPSVFQLQGVDGQPMREPRHPILAEDKLRHVGEPVVLVVAETLAQAQAAAALVQLRLQELPAVVDAAVALGAASVLHERVAPDNLCFHWTLGDAAAAEAAFARAAHVTRLTLRNQRLIPNALEPRAAVASHDPAEDRSTLYVSHQSPHLERLLLCAEVLGIPEPKLRVIAPELGGGFGSKAPLYAEETALLQASRQLGRPVKWCATRAESFAADAHARDHHTEAELALDANGEFLALRVRTLANLGAYLSSFAACVPSLLYASLLAGPYRTPHIHCDTRAVFSNTAPVDGFSGAGRAEACYVVERLIDCAARELGIDPFELRRRNFVRRFPHQTPTGLNIDSGDPLATLEQVLGLADLSGYPARQAVSAARGLKRGIGLSCYVEAAGLAAGATGARVGLFETAELRVHPTGGVTVCTAARGHETLFAQLVAARLGLRVEDVELVQGDTGRVPFGLGGLGGPSLAVGGCAIDRALDKLILKAGRIAARLLDCEPEELRYEAGRFERLDGGAACGWAELAQAAHRPQAIPGLEPGLNESAAYAPIQPSCPGGAHLCEVEVDPRTGQVRIERYSAVDDMGTVLNPLLAAGQQHGGIALGLGQALLEQSRYDETNGQLLSASYLDYALPRCDDLPYLSVQLATGTRCLHNPLGAKDGSEVGAIAAPAALINAVCDALDLRALDMPATPWRVWQALQEDRA